MERVSLPASACATPPHRSWEAGIVKEKDVKLKSAVNHLVQSMEVGDPGRHGIPALLPVVEGSRHGNDSVLILSPNMEERTAWVMQL